MRPLLVTAVLGLTLPGDAYGPRPLSLFDARYEVAVVFVAVRLEVEIRGDMCQPLVAHAFYKLLHEGIICSPGDAIGAYRRLLGACGDLVGVKIVEIEFVDQGFFDGLVEDQIAVYLYRPPLVRESRRQVAVDIDGAPILTIACQIRDIAIPA